jgi:hypothetical protein
VVLSDFLDPAGLGGLEGLATLTAARHEASLVRVVSPAEAEPRLRGHLTLVDAETGRARKLHVTAGLAAEYKRAFELYSEGLRAFAAKRRLTLAEARSDRPFEDFVLRSLREARILV